MLLQAAAPVEAGVADELIFRPITASDGIADNSAQTIKCTFTGRMTITTIGSINFYDGANFSHINNEKEVKYRLDDYDGHYHLYYDNSHHLWLKNTHTVSCVNLTTETYFQNIDSIFARFCFQCPCFRDIDDSLRGIIRLSTTLRSAATQGSSRGNAPSIIKDPRGHDAIMPAFAACII
jgi:hypothetical protein